MCIRCHQPINRDLKHPDSNSVSVDHYPVPVKDLPPDHPLHTDHANLFLAHLGCNARAGVKVRDKRKQSRQW